VGQRVWRSKYLSRGTKVEVFKRLVLLVLLYGCETWTLTDDSSGRSSLRRILGYRRYNFKSNDRLLEKTSMKHISELVFEREMAMFSHVARLSPNDPAHRIHSCCNLPGWRRGRPPKTRLKQMEEYCRGSELTLSKPGLGFRQ
jgi:hypothetical protein